MNGTESSLLAMATFVSSVVILVAAVGVAWRLIKGPSAADRVVALDVLGILMVAFAAVFAVSAGEAAFLDVALALALIAFLGTVAFARYVERRIPADPDPAGGTDDAGAVRPKTAQ